MPLALVGPVQALVTLAPACYAQTVSSNLITVVVFGAMWIGMAGFFFTVVRFISVSEAKRGPGEASADLVRDVHAGGNAGDGSAEATATRPFELGL